MVQLTGESCSWGELNAIVQPVRADYRAEPAASPPPPRILAALAQLDLYLEQFLPVSMLVADQNSTLVWVER